jgi:hypothetical protein
MNPQTNTFLSIEGNDGVLAGEWYAVPHNGRDTITIAISLQGGTATWHVDGRNSPLDDALELDTGSADEAISVPRFAQMRVRLSASSGADFTATGSTPMREIEEL